MSAWWLVVAFLVGWFACWKLSRFFVKHVLRRGNVIMEEALSGLTQDALLKVAATVETELAKRRAVPNQDRDPASEPVSKQPRPSSDGWPPRPGGVRPSNQKDSP